jgi:hypothetical protein
MDMPAVPSKQEIHSIDAGEGDVRRVTGGARRNHAGAENAARQCFDVVVCRQHWEGSDRFKAQTGGLDISLRGLVQNFR